MGLDTGIVYALLFVSLYFEVFLLVSFLENKMTHAASRSDAAPFFPAVAVVVPCHNEERSLSATIRSLLSLSYPAEKLEIIVVDDGSTDRTLEVARRFEGDPRVSIFHKENGGKYTALNLALSRTGADLIGCLDADSEVEPDALARIASVFRDPKIAAATPGIHVREPRSILEHLQHVEYRLSIFNRFVLAALGSVFITPGPFSLFRAESVRALGGWQHGHSTEDMEMALRLQSAGFLICNVPGAMVHTTAPKTLPHLFRQRVRWTYGFLRNLFDYRHMLGNRSFGTLGLLVLPAALVSIATALFLFARVLWYSTEQVSLVLSRYQLTGALPRPSFDAFYLDTSALLLLVLMAVALVVALIATGTAIGTQKRLPPAATPLFLLCYGFLAPAWLGTAVVRAALKTGVRWS